MNMKNNNIELYDTTLRDGTQQEGISLSVQDKLLITKRLDDFGVHYIEGGWPGSNPKDAEFFAQAKKLSLKNSQLAAFSSTRRSNTQVEKDINMQTLLEAETPVVTLVGKSWDLHVTEVLETTLKENLLMISDSVSFLEKRGRKVVFDAEHFFDGYKANKEYALECLLAAQDSGVSCLTLCDTNGGTLPNEIGEIVSEIRSKTKCQIGIHTHNDTETAVASSLVALYSGATQIQGTVNGYGERCGNANLLTIIGNLQLKLGIKVIDPHQIELLSDLSNFVSEIANLPHNQYQPYVGKSAFVHKAGLHASAVSKVRHSYQHIEPNDVGNSTRVVISELAGRSNIREKLKEIGLKASTEIEKTLIETIKNKENIGFQYDGAEASFEMLFHKSQSQYKQPFEIIDFLLVAEKNRRTNDLDDANLISEVTVKVKVGEKVMHTAASGNGPVNALDAALRKGLIEFFPSLTQIKLTDYKVRVIDQGGGSDATVRVLVESTDGKETWRTVGCSPNIIEASRQALVDSLEWWLIKNK